MGTGRQEGRTGSKGMGTGRVGGTRSKEMGTGRQGGGNWE